MSETTLDCGKFHISPMIAMDAERLRHRENDGRQNCPQRVIAVHPNTSNSDALVGLESLFNESCLVTVNTPALRIICIASSDALSLLGEDSTSLKFL